ncbi:MAG: Fic family protein [Alphaproteobacteria bacterium]|nr:Fic family protein [Alphaproteobacteria bacterium]
MKKIKKNQISRSVSYFHGRPLPEKECWIAGYASLIDSYDLKIPLPNKLAAISLHHKRYDTDNWSIYTPRYKPDQTIASQLTFALKYEGVNLTVLSALFQRMSPEEIEEWIKSEPVGRYSRRIWFLYEWLTDKKLNLPDAQTGNFVDVLDPKQQYVGPSKPSKRQRVHNNLTGVQNFCPLVWRTEKLEKFRTLHIDSLAREKTGLIHPDVLARAAAFLLLQDSRASFAIEGERPPKNRAERWGRAIGQAGLHPLSINELLRLQTIVIEDHRFIHMGLRQEGGFIGAHERSTNLPLPDHISAKWQDLSRLIQGMVESYEYLKASSFDPVILAALISFGFVFIHPFEDGNGRIHRYLMHHVLAERGFSQKGVTFPLSTVILRRIDEYKRVLEDYSRPRLEFIEWHPTPNGNVDVLNETIDLYRYFDATQQAEFLYECVYETVEHILPEEIDYLKRYDEMKSAINERFDMPNHLTDLLIHFLQQNGGKLSKRAQENEFKELSQEECSQLESLYRNIM